MKKLSEASGKVLEPGDIVRPRIKLEDCLDSFASPCEVADFYSSAIKARTTAFKTTKLKTFPDYLVLHMARFVIGDNWAVKKLDAFVEVPDEIDLSFLRAKGKQSDEIELEDEAEVRTQTMLQPNEGIVAQIVDMGFPRNRAEKAAVKTDNAGAEAAMEWLFAHMDDADIDSPL